MKKCKHDESSQQFLKYQPLFILPEDAIYGIVKKDLAPFAAVLFFVFKLDHPVRNSS